MRNPFALSKPCMGPNLTRVSYSIVRLSTFPYYAELLIQPAVLMARPDGKIRENTAGINSMLFYHATVIIHGIFSGLH